MNPAPTKLGDQVLLQAFSRLQPLAFGVSLGVVTATVLFALTAALLLGGSAGPGGEVGPHLGLLRHYLPGYTVTWPGALVGAAWGAAIGLGLGYLAAGLLNFHHALYLRVLERRFRRQGLLDG